MALGNNMATVRNICNTHHCRCTISNQGWRTLSDVTAGWFAVNVTINNPIYINIISIITVIAIITISNITINTICTHFPNSLRLSLVPLTVRLLTPKYGLAATRPSVSFFLREVLKNGELFTKYLSQYTM
jgi:hypothetical protein